MKPKKLSRRIGGTLAKAHETQKTLLERQRRGFKIDHLEDEELERIARLEKLEEERDQL